MSVTVKTIPVGEDGIAALFMFSFNEVDDTSSQVPAFNAFAPSQLRYNEKSSLNSTYDLSAEEQLTALRRAVWINWVISVPAGIGILTNLNSGYCKGLS